MNYWPAEAANLAELHEPLLSFIPQLAVNGARPSRPTTAPAAGPRTTTAISGGTVGAGRRLRRRAIRCGRSGRWPARGCRSTSTSTTCSAATWRSCATAPTRSMKGAAEFCLDWLIDDGHGHLVTSPSTSPEHKFITADGGRAAVSMASTMDMALIRDLFSNLIDAAEVLERRRRVPRAARVDARRGCRRIASAARGSCSSGSRSSRTPSRITGTSRTCSACIRAGRSRRARRSCSRRCAARTSCAATAAPAGAWPGRSITGRGCSTAITRSSCSGEPAAAGRQHAIRTTATAAASTRTCSTRIRRSRSTATSA